MILDPFFGSGTTGAVAKKLGRNWIGCDESSEYAEIATKRIAKIRAEKDLELLRTQSKRSLPRVPFGNVVERGMLKAGDVLYDGRRRYSAKVRADGTLVTSDFKGSIHQVGAFVQKAPSCNGWQFWYVEKRGKLIPIESYREKIRADMH